MTDVFGIVSDTEQYLEHLTLLTYAKLNCLK